MTYFFPEIYWKEICWHYITWWVVYTDCFSWSSHQLHESGFYYPHHADENIETYSGMLEPQSTQSCLAPRFIILNDGTTILTLSIFLYVSNVFSVFFFFSHSNSVHLLSSWNTSPRQQKSNWKLLWMISQLL